MAGGCVEVFAGVWICLRGLGIKMAYGLKAAFARLFADNRAFY